MKKVGDVDRVTIYNVMSHDTVPEDDDLDGVWQLGSTRAAYARRGGWGSTW